MFVITTLSSILTLGVGASVLAANPLRPSNRAFAAFTLVLSAWLVCVLAAMAAGQAREAGESSNLEFWLRANAMISSFSPWCVWLIHGSILANRHEILRAIVNSIPILFIGLVLSFFCLSKSFVISDQEIFRRGFIYYAHTTTVIFLFSITFVRILKSIPSSSGVKKLELQYLALSAGVVALLLAVLNGLGNLLHFRALNRASIFVVFAAYLFMAWALAHRRIFNAGQVLISVGQRIAVAGILAAAAWTFATPLSHILDPTPAWICSVFACGIGAFWLDQKTRHWLGLESGRPLALLRAEALEEAQGETGTAGLVQRFENLLARHHTAATATILDRRGDSYVGHGVELAVRQPGFSLLCEDGWTTPESLQRRRQVPELIDLGNFLEQHSLGVVVTAPSNSLTPSILIALGRKKNESPYTYPEVQRLQNVAELIDNLLIHSRLTDQVALRARLEHLALMSRGLAHDLKNLLTPVTEFLAHLEGFFPTGSPQAEVHAEALRSVGVMGDYLRETLFFSNRLEPHFTPVNLDRLLEGLRSAVGPRAARRDIRLDFTCTGGCELSADQALLQRLLSNLIINSIDASKPHQAVQLSVSNDGPGWVRFTIRDEGHGMTPETTARMFDPYFTTKDRRGESHGVGLGLTISQKIVNLHAGRIAVTSRPGQGTTITVHFPSMQARPRPTSGAA